VYQWEMEETYNGYLIHSGAAPRPTSNEWKPIAQVNWTENGQDRVKLWMEWCFARSFSSYKEAETEAHLFAESWIDENSTLEK
jgi:hypothetical protein